MNIMPPVRLSNEERGVLRKRITAHPDWPEYRNAHSMTAADLTTTRAVEVAHALGVDTSGLDVPDAELIEETKPTMNHQPSPAPVGAIGDQTAALQALQTLLGGNTGPQIDALNKRVTDLEAQGVKIVTVDADGTEIGALPPMRHAKQETLVKAASARDAAGHRLNVWLSGPAGSGKTKAAEMTAEALGLTFGFHGAMTMAFELTGFVDAGGTYHETQFVKLYRDGGLCLLDEIDAGSSEALLALNGALANGIMSLPNGEIIKRHADFVCVGAANTWGHGATADYIGRAKIDAAFLDRFGARIDWDYDAKLERVLSGNEEWARRVQAVRKAAVKHGLKVVITPRATINGAALIRNGFTPDEAADLTYLAGLTPEQVKQLEG